MADLNLSDPSVIVARAAARAATDVGQCSLNARLFFRHGIKDDVLGWLLCTAGVIAMLGVSQTTFTRRMRHDPDFPQPYMKKHGRLYWIVFDVMKYMETKNGPTDKDQMISGSMGRKSPLI